MAQRYDIWINYDTMETDKDDNGDWVKYDDHAAEITQLRAELASLRAENERLREALQRVSKSGSHSSARIHARLALNPAKKADSVEHCLLCETPYSYHHDCSCGLCKSSVAKDVVFGLRSALCLIADMCDDPVMRRVAKEALK